MHDKVVILGSFAPSLINFRGDLIRQLSASGCQLVLCAPKIGEHSELVAEATRLGAKMYSAPLARKARNPLSDVIYILFLIYVFLKEKPGVIFSYTIKPAVYGSVAAYLTGINKRLALITGLGETYDDLLRGYDSVKLPVRRPGYKNSYWMYHIDLVGGETPGYRNQVILAMARRGVECRPGFVSYTLQNFCSANDRMLYPCPEAEAKSFSTLYLPSSHMITVAEQRTVAAQLADAIKEASALT